MAKKQSKIQISAQRKLQRAVNAGLLVRMPCEVCGKSPTDGHHPDYTKPLDVVWLCRLHHLGLHAATRPKKPPKPRKPWPKRVIRKKPVKYFAGYATLAKMRQLWKREKMVG